MAGKILDIPVFATTQSRAKLGPTVAELQLDEPGLFPVAVHADKTTFSMWVSAVKEAVPLAARASAASNSDFKEGLSAALVGIEAHICVTQTALDMLNEGHKVYVLADGVSSCNREEVPIALARLRAAGAVVTTSESWLYECMGDANIFEFREMTRLVKETADETKAALGALCSL
jgi:nicotinamidase-related amidase